MCEHHSLGSHYGGCVPDMRHLSAVWEVLLSYTKIRCIFRVEDIKAKALTDTKNFVRYEKIILIPYKNWL
jgi:hypothetical protein